MPAQPLFDARTGRFYSPSEIKSVVVNFDQAVTGKWPALKFPVSGRVLSATLFINNEVSSGTNLLLAGLRNGGVTGAGTIITAAQTSGTILAGSAYAMTVATNGPDAYAIGELAMLDITTTLSPTDLSVQIDYLLDVV
jgi:hypothetical protein